MNLKTFDIYTSCRPGNVPFSIKHTKLSEFFYVFVLVYGVHLSQLADMQSTNKRDGMGLFSILEPHANNLFEVSAFNFLGCMLSEDVIQHHFLSVNGK